MYLHRNIFSSQTQCHLKKSSKQQQQNQKNEEKNTKQKEYNILYIRREQYNWKYVTIYVAHSFVWACVRNYRISFQFTHSLIVVLTHTHTHTDFFCDADWARMAALSWGDALQFATELPQ